MKIKNYSQFLNESSESGWYIIYSSDYQLEEIEILYAPSSEKVWDRANELAKNPNKTWDSYDVAGPFKNKKEIDDYMDNPGYFWTFIRYCKEHNENNILNDSKYHLHWLSTPYKSYKNNLTQPNASYLEIAVDNSCYKSVQRYINDNLGVTSNETINCLTYASYNKDIKMINLIVENILSHKIKVNLIFEVKTNNSVKSLEIICKYLNSAFKKYPDSVIYFRDLFTIISLPKWFRNNWEYLIEINDYIK